MHYGQGTIRGRTLGANRIHDATRHYHSYHSLVDEELVARSKELVYGVGRLSRSQVFAKRGLHTGVKKSEKPAAADVAATKEKQEAERREREGDRGDEPRRPIERPKIVWFKPTDKRVPLIAIPTEQAPPDFVQNSEAYANKLFVACIKRHVRRLYF